MSKIQRDNKRKRKTSRKRIKSDATRYLLSEHRRWLLYIDSGIYNLVCVHY